MSDLAKLQADMDFIKHLAAEGQQLPLNSGGPLFLAGLIFGVASLLHYGSAVLGFWDVSTGWIWGGAMLLYAVCCFIWCRVHRYAHHSPGTRNRIIGTLWGCIGFSIFLFSLVFAIISYRLQLTAIIVAMPAMVLVLYGLGWVVTAYVAEQRWMQWVGVGCCSCAPLVAWFAQSPEQILIYALALFAFALVPGWLLMQKEKAAP